MLPEPVKVVLDFVQQVNQNNAEGVAALLAPDHTFVDLAGDTEQGYQRIAAGWRDYLTQFPKYRLYIRRIVLLPIGVALIGQTTGSHLQIPDEQEFNDEGVIWLATVEHGLLKTWQLYADSVVNANALNLEGGQEIYAPVWFARTIAKHLDLLPPGSRTDDVRNVRKYYSRLYRKAPPETLLEIAERLFFEEGYRFVPYELIYYHPGTIALLNPEKVQALSVDINHWAAADTFSQFISGPTWKQGVISDDLIGKWIISPDFWYRRIAVVSTIYLDGDSERMLKYAAMLVDDHEDMIVKALSWVLRRAIRYDRKGVEQFLADHKHRLAARIKREVRNKLDTGLKNPTKN
ncbi:DNA alkylation repair protein (plasmid) [Chloroflexota bacterium]|nr:DNA alkylation repair protein [Chloroflexota bacterium]